MDSDVLLDALLDLKHDLGKHLQLPMVLLPKCADPKTVREAARLALARTLRCQRGHCFSARELWDRFVAEAGTALEHEPAFKSLEEAVERALAWEQRLSACPPKAWHPCSRREISRDFHQVGESITRLIEDLQRETPLSPSGPAQG